MMITNLKPYPAYKDSGVPWLGQVPEHWEVIQVKRAYNIQLGKMLQNVPSSPEDILVPYFKALHVQWSGVILKNLPTMWASPRDLNQYGVCIGDLLVCEGGEGGRCAIVNQVDSRAIIQNALHRVRPRGQSSNKFLQLTLRTIASTGWFEALNDKATIAHFTREKFAALQIALPPLPEQTAIVRFLDWAEGRIRRVIMARKRRVKLLEEYKQALIHQAVTGKIDVRTGQPYPVYKPSGVEWLGEVPAHWEVKPVKRHYAIQLGKMLQTRPNSPDDIEVPYLKAQHIQWFSVRTSDAPRMWASPRDIQQFGITAGDLLVCEGGEGGRCGIVKEIPDGFIIQNALHRVRPRDHCRNDYLQYVMSVIAATGWFEALNNKATIAHFTREKFGALCIPIPVPDEQTAIVEYLDAQTAKIDAAIAAARREIELLREYRERLIADVVTGKVDVREVAAQLPEELNEPELLIDADEGEGEASEMSEINGEVLEDVADE